MKVSIYSKFMKKITAIVTIILFLFSFLPTQMVFALNGQGNNPLDNMGYRIVSNTEIVVWLDKGLPGSATKEQFKLFKGSSSAAGTPINISYISNLPDPDHVTSNNTTYQGSSGGGGFTINVGSADAFIPGQTYTLVTSGSVVANNGHSLWQFNSNQDLEFNFTMPDNTNAITYNQLNCQETYNASKDVEPLLSSWLTSANVNVPLERNIWFSFNMPVTKIGTVPLSTLSPITGFRDINGSATSINQNNTVNIDSMGNLGTGTNLNFIAQAVKVYKMIDGSWIPVTYNPFTNGGANTQNPTNVRNALVQDKNELGAPVISDDNTCISIPMSAGASAISYGYACNTKYKVTLPQLTFANGKTMAAQEFTFTTTPALPSADMAKVNPSAVSDPTTPGNIQISWTNLGAVGTLNFTQIGSIGYKSISANFAPTGYNIYYSTNMYWDFKLLNTEGPISPSAGTYSFDPTAKGLNPNTPYYFRVSSLNNINSVDQLAKITPPSVLSSGGFVGGLSLCQAQVPSAPILSYDDTANTISGIGSNMEYRIDNGNWIKFDATNFDPDLSGNHIVDVRVAAGNGIIEPAGYIKTMKFTTNPPAAPSLTADDAANKIVGINPTMEYSIDNGSWTKYTANPDLSGDHTVYVRVAADASTGTPAGIVTTLTFTTNPAAPAAPGVTADDAANKIVGINSTMEYCIYGGSWIKYAADPDLTGNHTVMVRIPADDTTGTPAGEVTTLTFTTNPVAPAAPSVTANDAVNTVTGMAAGMEYSLDGAAYVPFDAAAFNAINFSGNHTLNVRVAANASTGAPASAITVLKFTNAPTASVVNVTPTVSDDSTSAAVNVTVNEDQINMDGTNVITVPNSASSVSTSISITSIKNGVGTEEVHATVGENALTLAIPFDAVNLSSINDSTAKFVLSQRVSTDAAAAGMLANAPAADKTIGKIFSFNLDVAGKPVHSFADGKTATIAIKLTADDIKGLDTSKLSAYYYDETSNKWIQVGGSYNPSTMIFTFSTTHFTSFTIMQKPTSTVSSTLPKTGSPVDFFTLMLIGVSFLGAGLFITVKKWRRNIQ